MRTLLLILCLTLSFLVASYFVLLLLLTLPYSDVHGSFQAYALYVLIILGCVLFSIFCVRQLKVKKME